MNGMVLRMLQGTVHGDYQFLHATNAGRFGQLLL